MATCCSLAIKTGQKGVCMSWSDYSIKNWLITILSIAMLITGLVLFADQLKGAQAETSPDGLKELRISLLADPSSVSGNWLRTLNPDMKNVQGDLVWNSTQQQGVMRLLDLPKPKAGTFYQLWLYDALGGNQEPVSGGILQQGSGKTELFAPIKTTTVVQEPYKFELKLQTNNYSANGKILLMVQP